MTFFNKEKCYKNDKDEKDANEEKNNNEKKCDKWKYIVNYANYIKGIKRLSNETNKKFNAKQQLYESIKEKLGERAADDEVYKNILVEMEQETFLEKINNVDNSAIPYQLNLWKWIRY